MYTVVDEGQRTGNVYWVDSGASTAADATTNGASPYSPFATLHYAASQCTANNGDVIYLMPGHAETLASAGVATISIAGISIIGVGQGGDRPAFTFSNTASSIVITGASTTLQNVVLIPSIDSVTNPLHIQAASCTIADVEVQDASSSIEFVRVILTTAPADRLSVIGMRYNGFIAGNACVNAIRLVGCSDALIRDCNFYGKASTAWIEFSGSVCSNVSIEDSVFYCSGTTDLSKNVVDTITGSTWHVDGFDAAAAEQFSGGSASAVASDNVADVATILGTSVNGTTTDTLHGKIGTDTEMDDNSLYDLLGSALKAAALSQRVTNFATKTSTSALTSGTIFDWTGSIEILHIVGRVTTVIQAQATTTKLQITPDALAAADLCATLDIDAFAVGSLLSITGTAANAMVGTTAVGNIGPGQANPVVATCVTGGTITTVFGAASTGAIVWEVLWRPLSAGATLTAA